MDYGQRYWERRFGRRGLLRTASLAGAGLAGAALIGCGDTDEAPAPTAAPGASTPGTGGTAAPAATPAGPQPGQPRQGGTLRLHVSSTFGHLHPQRPGGGPQTRINTYSNLIHWDYTNDRPGFMLAESYEQVDPTKLIIHIRQNAKWQDLPPTNGRTLTSEDVDISWTRYVEDPVKSGATAIHDTWTTSRETPDQKTLVMNFSEANFYIIGPHGLCGPIPSTFGPPELSRDDQLERAVGAGPYHLERFDPASEMSFIRRPDGWVDDRPYIDRIVYKVITDSATQAAAFRAGDIDQLLARDILQAQEFEGYSPNIRIDKDLGFSRMFFMNGSRPPFNDIRARQAVYAALDIDELIDKVDFGEGEFGAPVPPYLKARLPEEETRKYYPNDQQRARQLLESTGFDFSQELVWKYPTRETAQLMAEAMAEQLGRVGLRIRLVGEHPTTTWSAVTMNRQLDYDFSSSERYIVGTDADIELRQFYSTGSGGFSRAGFGDAEVDRLIEAQQREFDDDKRLALIHDAQRAILDAAHPIMNIWCPYDFVGRWKRYNPVLDQGYYGRYGHIEWIEE
jgi:peptide/nickel transport system substrate-binding protein